MRMRIVAILLAAWAGLAWAAGPARLACDERSWDFGTVANHQDVEHVFRLRNEGGAPVLIQRVRACCGATAALSSKIIPPGEAVELTVRLSLAGRLGAQKKSVYVISDDPVESCFPIQLSGTATAALVAFPPRFDFGNVDAGAGGERMARILSVTGGVFHVTNLSATVSWAAPRWEPDPSGTSGKLWVAIKPPLPEGALAGRVILLTDLPGYPRLDLPVAARQDSEVVVVPQALVLRGGAAGGATRYVAVRRRNGEPFRLLEVVTPEKEVIADVAPLGSNGYRVAISGIGAAPSLKGKAVMLHTDVKGMEEIEVPFIPENESE